MAEPARRGRFWQGVAAFVGGAALLAGGALAGVMLARPKKKTQRPLWQPVTGDPTTASIAIPANATFAMAVPSTDPKLAAISGQFSAANLLALGMQGVQQSQPGQPAPPGFPADGLGTNAWRVTGVNAKAGDALPLDISQSTQVWLYAGVTSVGVGAQPRNPGVPALQMTATQLAAYLRSHGCDCTPALQALTRAFQKAWNTQPTRPGSSIMSLAVDGEFGPSTLTALNIALGGTNLTACYANGKGPCDSHGRPIVLEPIFTR